MVLHFIWFAVLASYDILRVESVTGIVESINISDVNDYMFIHIYQERI